MIIASAGIHQAQPIEYLYITQCVCVRVCVRVCVCVEQNDDC